MRTSLDWHTPIRAALVCLLLTLGVIAAGSVASCKTSPEAASIAATHEANAAEFDKIAADARKAADAATTPEEAALLRNTANEAGVAAAKEREMAHETIKDDQQKQTKPWTGLLNMLIPGAGPAADALLLAGLPLISKRGREHYGKMAKAALPLGEFSLPNVGKSFVRAWGQMHTTSDPVELTTNAASVARAAGKMELAAALDALAAAEKAKA